MLLGINRQFYYRRKWSERKNKQKAEKVIQVVQQLRRDMPRLGGRKLYHLLYDNLRELGVGRDKLFTILRANQLLVTPKRSHKRTTNSFHRFKKHKNLIENIELVAPEQVWVSDITYVSSAKHHYYLALITDAYSKKIVGYDLSESLSTKGSLRALRMANKSRIYTEMELIHHSDRGIQYCSDSYQKQLKKYRIKCSMTESYDPYANAVAERVNGILKQEFSISEYNLSLKDMQRLIKDTIHIYNEKRPHASCGYNTPDFMHRQNKIKIKTYKKVQANHVART